MCRERAALARKEMEYSLMEYWLVEAEEWKQLKETLEPLLGTMANCSSNLAAIEQRLKANDARRRLREPPRLCEM